MLKNNPIHRGTFCLCSLWNAKIVLGIVVRVVLGLKSFDIPLRCVFLWDLYRSLYLSVWLSCFPYCSQSVKTVGIMNVFYLYLPSFEFVFVFIASLSVTCHNDMRIEQEIARRILISCSIRLVTRFRSKHIPYADKDSFLSNFRSSRLKETQRRLQNVSINNNLFKIVTIIFLSLE